ncbi:MAG: hypothetical protein AB7E04_03010 [Desulfobacteraceae bacterium]
MSYQIKKIIKAIKEFVLLSFMALIPPLTIFFDSKILKYRGTERTITEITQETLLIISALIFWYSGKKFKKVRGFFILAAGFFTCMFIREMDGFLDNIWKGFWLLPAIFTAGCSVFFALFYCKDSIIDPMADFIDSKPYFFIITGLIIIIVFSRVFGSGSLIWKHILPGEPAYISKTFIQEGLELYGYLFITHGSLINFFKIKKNEDFLP